MRVRMPLIIEESILKEIDEIAGEKHKRAATIEKALREFIERQAKKPAAKTAASKTAPGAVKPKTRARAVAR